MAGWANGWAESSASTVSGATILPASASSPCCFPAGWSYRLTDCVPCAGRSSGWARWSCWPTRRCSPRGWCWPAWRSAARWRWGSRWRCRPPRWCRASRGWERRWAGQRWPCCCSRTSRWCRSSSCSTLWRPTPRAAIRRGCCTHWALARWRLARCCCLAAICCPACFPKPPAPKARNCSLPSACWWWWWPPWSRREPVCHQWSAR